VEVNTSHSYHNINSFFVVLLYIFFIFKSLGLPAPNLRNKLKKLSVLVQEHPFNTRILWETFPRCFCFCSIKDKITCRRCI
jgi:hypothetical protein